MWPGFYWGLYGVGFGEGRCGGSVGGDGNGGGGGGGEWEVVMLCRTEHGEQGELLCCYICCLRE